MNHEPLIDEANNTAAYITNEEGYDVALLQRVLEKSPVGEPRITDADWQSLVSLINAAPALLAALTQLVDEMTANEDGELLYGDWLGTARAAVDKATK